MLGGYGAVRHIVHAASFFIINSILLLPTNGQFCRQSRIKRDLADRLRYGQPCSYYSICYNDLSDRLWTVSFHHRFLVWRDFALHCDALHEHFLEQLHRSGTGWPEYRSHGNHSIIHSVTDDYNKLLRLCCRQCFFAGYGSGCIAP